MKMIMAVLLVKAFIGLVEKNKKITNDKNESSKKIIHPAEFEIR